MPHTMMFSNVTVTAGRNEVVLPGTASRPCSCRVSTLPFSGPVQKYNFQQYIKYLTEGQPVPQNYDCWENEGVSTLIFKDNQLENLTCTRFFIPDPGEKFQRLNIFLKENLGAVYRYERSNRGQVVHTEQISTHPLLAQ